MIPATTFITVKCGECAVNVCGERLVTYSLTGWNWPSGMCIHVCRVRAMTVNVLKEPFQKPDLSVTVTNDEEVWNKTGGRRAMCWCFNLTKGWYLS